MEMRNVNKRYPNVHRFYLFEYRMVTEEEFPAEEHVMSNVQDKSVRCVKYVLQLVVILLVILLEILFEIPLEILLVLTMAVAELDVAELD